MKQFIPLSVPNLKGNELEYVTNVVKEEWVSTAGSMVDRFEKGLAEYLKAPGVIACQSGTAGLHLAMLLLGIGRDDEVIVPTLTFIAAVNPVSYVGAAPVFMDCDHSLCIDVYKVEKFLEERCDYIGGKVINHKTGRQIKAIVAVHVFGNLCNMEKLCELAERYDLKLIEDATEAIGSYYTEGHFQGKHAGTMGDIGVYSFNGNKIITTGGGGALTAKEPEILAKAKYLSTQAKDDEVYFIHNEIGYNYRMTNLQAALGVAQLEQLDEFIAVKKENFMRYKKLFSQNAKADILEFVGGIEPNFWFYALLLKDTMKTKEELIQQLKEDGIQIRPVWCLIHKQKPYVKEEAYEIENAYYYEQNVINLPCSSNLSSQEVDYVSDRISKWI